MDPNEEEFWRHGRYLMQFIGICGAGKSTLSRQLAERCRSYGGTAVGTLDWDPHIADDERLSDRAFRRDLDLALAADPACPQTHRWIVEHSLGVIDDWRRSAANLIVVDRFIESYDHLTPEEVQGVQRALSSCDRTVINVLLVIGDLFEDLPDRIQQHLLQTKTHRPASWWASGPGTAEEWADGEMQCQAAYRRYCRTSPFPTWVLDSTDGQWGSYGDAIVAQTQMARAFESERQSPSRWHNLFPATPVSVFIDVPASCRVATHPGHRP